MEYNQITGKKRKGKKEKVKRHFDVHLPTDYPWKVITSLVTDLEHQLPNNFILTIRDIARKRDVAALLDFIDEWSLQSIWTKLPGAATDVISAVYQVSSLLKRFRFNTTESSRVQIAIEKFMQAEAQCSTFNNIGVESLKRLSEPWDLAVFTYARSFLAKLLGPVPDWFKVSQNGVQSWQRKPLKSWPKTVWYGR